MFCHCGRRAIEFKIVIAIGRWWGQAWYMMQFLDHRGRRGKNTPLPQKMLCFATGAQGGKLEIFANACSGCFSASNWEEHLSRSTRCSASSSRASPRFRMSIQIKGNAFCTPNQIFERSTVSVGCVPTGCHATPPDRVAIQRNEI